MKTRILAALCAVLLLVLAACQSSAPGKGKIIRCDIPDEVTTLDPQFASSAAERLIIANIYEGLLTRGENGELVAGVAESYDISDDGLNLNFHLRSDAKWKNGQPVTADDFVYAFRRMFAPNSSSPFAKDYIAILNSDDVAEGKSPPSSLGVAAKSSTELEITLSHPSPFFPDVLAETPAVPCNEAFFVEARGRYGLDKDFINANGPFYLERWDNETSIRLLANAHYASSRPVSSGGVSLYVNVEETPLSRLLDGSSDVAEVSYEDSEKLKQEGYTIANFNSKVWCIAFNLNSEIWGNPLLRQGLAQTIEPQLLREQMPQKLVSTPFLVTPEVTLAGKKYRDIVKATSLGFDPEQGLRLFEMGISALSIDNLSNSSFLVPNSPEHLLAMGMVQQSWQKYLPAYINLSQAPIEDVQKRFATENYDMTLVSLGSTTSSASNTLEMFRTNSPNNHFGYSNALFDALLDTIGDASTIDEAADAYARAESMLLQDAVIIPLYLETTAFAAAPKVSGINPTPFLSELNFKYVEK